MTTASPPGPAPTEDRASGGQDGGRLSSGLQVGGIVAEQEAVGDRVVTFSGSYVTDPASGVLKMFAYVSLGITFLYSREYLQNNGLLKGEFFVLGLFGLLGIMIMISAHSLLTLYLGLEVLAEEVVGLLVASLDEGADRAADFMGGGGAHFASSWGEVVPVWNPVASRSTAASGMSTHDGRLRTS